ncbi:CDP-alcohol phosphatidyltransferase family protein [Alphaproteobacteria bacterium]|nr:CDP-alcohol phosphatidyltransferase family protein [Alphaproteobacteria bacterium]
MFDRHLQKFTQKPLSFFAKIILKYLSASQVTIIGFIFGLIMCLFIFLELFFLAIIFFILNRICDGLDGIMARLTAPTYLGAYLDIVLDFIFYSAFILIFGLIDTSHVVISCLLLFSYICTGTTFLAQAVIQPKLDLIQKDENLDIDIPKSIYYSAGLIEGSETILFMMLCLLFPNLYFFFGLIFTILCLITALSRILIFYKKNNSF